jgi:RNA polymerase primary sigma factor
VAQVQPRSQATPKKVVKEKAKKLTTSPKVAKPTREKKPKSAVTTAKAATKAAGLKAEAPAVKPVPSEAKKSPGRPKKEPTATKGIEGKKTKVVQVVPPVVATEKEFGEETSDLETVEASLPDDIDAELDIEVEADAEITLDSLTTEIDEVTDPLDVDDLADDFDDDEFSEDSADEAEEELDLTEDLSEELSTDKFFRDSESNHEEDEEEIPRSW